MTWFTRLTNALSSRRLDTDLADEMHDHLERRAAELEASGCDPVEAAREARRAFGNATQYREQSRDIRLSTALEGTYQDVRYAWRGLIRNRVFAATAVVSLSLAIGATTAIYSIVDAAILRPLPVSQPDRLFTLSYSAGDASPDGTSANSEGFSYPLYETLRGAAGDAGQIALVDSPNRVEAQFGDDASPEEVVQSFVSENLFEMLGVPPAMGRLFSKTENRVARPGPVAVLSYDYWNRRFGADPAIVGKHLSVNGKPYEILGVARRGFAGVQAGAFVDVWLPIALTDPGVFSEPEFRPFSLIGRLAPGATREQLVARLQPAFHNHQVARTESGPAMGEREKSRLRAMRIVAQAGGTGISAFRQTYSRPLWVLLGVAACILLLACANVAGLLLAKSTARSGEMALRVSLGAGRARLVRQLLTESALISVLACLGGWCVARLTAPAFLALVSKQDDPVQLDLALDARVLVFCVAICAFSVLCFGVLPAWEATRTQPMSTLQRLRVSGGALQLGRWFVGVQTAIAFCLLTVGTGFLISLRNLSSVDTGFDPRGITVLRVTDRLGAQQRDQQLAAMRAMQSAAAETPGATAAATAWMPMFAGARRAQRVVLPGRAASDAAETFYRVSPGFLGTMRIPLLAGRDFELYDNDDEPVPTIVNRAFAKKYFGRESVLGMEFQRDDSVHHRIVGLAGDSHYASLRDGPEPIIYMPMKPTASFTLYVRSARDARSVGEMIGREATALGSGMRVRAVTTLDALVGNTMRTERLMAVIGATFAFLGLVLAAIGVFGLLNYSVTRRTKELGIRAALGARQWSLCALVVNEVFRTMVGGLVVGLAGFLFTMRFAETILFGVRPVDPTVIGTAAIVFIAMAVIAAGLPARRAATIDPVVALRND